MFRIEDVLQLKDNEQVLLVRRRHIVTLLPRLLFSLFLIVIPFFLLFTLFAWGILGVVLFGAVLTFGSALAIRSLILWDADVFLVTSLRLVDVDQRGIFSRVVSEVAIPSIQDVLWSKSGIMESLFRMGDVTVRTSNGATALHIKQIVHPQEAHALINDLRHHGGSEDVRGASREEKKPLEASSAVRTELLNSISVLLEKYSLEELRRIESVLKARERSTVTEAFLASPSPANTPAERHAVRS